MKPRPKFGCSYFEDIIDLEEETNLASQFHREE